MRQGTKLQVAYFDQMRAALDLDATLADTISPGSEWIEFNGQRKHVMSYLNDFLFAPERANSPVRTLSGGERNRLLLARLFALPANVLVLDEPTNDLDIDTLELLEELLQAYAGTVFLVSHDRRFLDNVVTSTIAWEGDGRAGPVARVRRRLRGLAAAARAFAPAGRGQAARGCRARRGSAGTRGQTAPAATARKLSFKEQRELEDTAGAHRGARSRAEAPSASALASADAVHATSRSAWRELAGALCADRDELLAAALERWESAGCVPLTWQPGAGASCGTRPRRSSFVGAPPGACG